jgi:hypothetical protein
MGGRQETSARDQPHEGKKSQRRQGEEEKKRGGLATNAPAAQALWLGPGGLLAHTQPPCRFLDTSYTGQGGGGGSTAPTGVPTQPAAGAGWVVGTHVRQPGGRTGKRRQFLLETVGGMACVNVGLSSLYEQKWRSTDAVSNFAWCTHEKQPLASIFSRAAAVASRLHCTNKSQQGTFQSSVHVRENDTTPKKGSAEKKNRRLVVFFVWA